MAKLIDIKCPKCAAPVHIAADATSVTCRYCGGTSVIDRGQPVTPEVPEVPEVPVAPATPSRGLGALIFSVVAIGGVAMAAGMVAVRGAPGPGSGAASVWSGAPGKGSVSSLQFHDRPMLAHVNADGILDVVGKSRGSDMAEYMAAFDGTSGAELWRSEAMTKDAADSGTLRGVLLGRVISVDALGKVQAYDLQSGTPAWSALLGEKGKRVCESAATIVIETADDERHGLDPITGKKRELAKGAPCTPVYSSDKDIAPGYRIVDWPEMEKLGIPRLSDIPGITAHRALVPDGTGPRFMLGQRDKGTAVAMVAAVDQHKKVLWKDIVPGVDPLTTDVNVLGVDAAYIDGKLLVPYALKDHDAGTRIACFAADTGQRLWDVQAQPKDDTSYGMAVSPESVFLTSWFDGTVVLDLKTGAPRYRIGK